MSRELLVFDFETLGTTPWKSCVLSLGVLACDWKDVEDDVVHVEALKDRGMHLFFGLKTQIKMGREVDPLTVDWWEQQGEEAQFVFTEKPRISILEIPELLNQYCKKEGVDKNTMVLIRGPHFDYPFLCSIYENCDLTEKDMPFSHWKIRDTRTIVDTCVGSGRGQIDGFSDKMLKRHGLIKHNALHDVIIDLLQCKAALTAEE